MSAPEQSTRSVWEKHPGDVSPCPEGKGEQCLISEGALEGGRVRAAASPLCCL